MHDLNTLNRLNAEAFGPAIKSLQRQGKHVVATYQGLSIDSIYVYLPHELETARAAATREPSSPTEHFTLFEGKYEEPNTLLRDQSEDRQAV